MAVTLFLNFNYFSWLSRESRSGLRTKYAIKSPKGGFFCFWGLVSAGPAYLIGHLSQPDSICIN